MIVSKNTMFDKVKNNEIIDESIESIDYDSLIKISELFDECVSEDNITLSEAFADNFKSEKIENFKKKLAASKDLKNQWTKLTKSMVTHKWIERYVTQAQENMIKKYLDIMNKDDIDFSHYRLAFVQICKFFGLPNKGVIIEWLEFQDKANEGRVASCRYSKGISRVNIPENVKLTHFSPVDKLTELNPSFKSKTKGKFFYDSPRVYFTVKERLNPFKFGIDSKQTRYVYQTDANIPVAYIDPTYILFKDRCVFVETKNPIKVHRVGTTSGKNIISGIKYDKK